MMTKKKRRPFSIFGKLDPVVEAGRAARAEEEAARRASLTPSERQAEDEYASRREAEYLRTQESIERSWMDD